MSRVVEYRASDGLEVLKEAKRPMQAPGDREVRTTVRAVGLNPLGFKTSRDGPRGLERVRHILHPRRWLEGASARFPRGVARDFADVIDTVDTSITDFVVGDAVLGTLRSAPDQVDTRETSTTELAAPVDDVTKKPTLLSFMRTACPGVAAQTAYGAFKQLNVYKGNVIVVDTAADDVGSVASQLAASQDATVVGIAGARNMDYLRSSGAIPITYGKNLTNRIRDAAPSPVTKPLNYYDDICVRLDRDLGLISRSIGTPVPSPVAIVKGTQFTGSRHSNGRDDLEEIAELVADDTTKVELTHTYSPTLEQIRVTYTELAKGRVRGKLVINLSWHSPVFTPVRRAA